MTDTIDKLRITGLKEPVVWIKDDNDNDKPIGWMAGVGVAGLKDRSRDLMTRII